MTLRGYDGIICNDGTARKKKGKRSERGGRKASGLKLFATMMAELLFEIISVLLLTRLEPFLLLGNGSFYATNYSRGRRYIVELDEVLMGFVAELDEEVFAHSKRVQSLALLLGERMGLTSVELNQLGLGAFLHDIGKTSVPAKVLNKEAPLTPEEWELVKAHPKVGFDLAESLGLSDSVKRIILEHHLWADGTGGYPQETGCTTPSLLSQITTVADVVDAMTSHRPYRQALPLSTCLNHLVENAGTKFNADIVAVFRALVSQGLLGFERPPSLQTGNPAITNGLTVGRR